MISLQLLYVDLWLFGYINEFITTKPKDQAKQQASQPAIKRATRSHHHYVDKALILTKNDLAIAIYYLLNFV